MKDVPLGRARDLAAALIQELTTAVPALSAIEPAGDLRRFDRLVSEIVIIARAVDPVSALSDIAALPSIQVVQRTGRKMLVLYRSTDVDIRVAAPDEYGTVLFAATGSAAHTRSVLARRGRAMLCSREEQVYADAGLPWIPPELREGAGEIEAAAAGGLPALIERQHIRGDLHMHTTYSDGRDTIDAMVSACHALGYQYIAITDHSQSAAASQTLGASEIPRQRDEIARLRERYPEMAILHGTEVDILPSGKLDYPDSILEQFDIVLTSLHERSGHDGARLTKRCLSALRHPLVNVVCHPANRLIGQREGYPMDFDAVYAAAADSGTALEIDGAPSHLDLDGAQARAAIQAGVTLTIDSDCHRADALDRQMQFGIGTARRGWVEPAHVLNTRPLAEVLAFISAKRRRSAG